MREGIAVGLGGGGQDTDSGSGRYRDEEVRTRVVERPSEEELCCSI